MSFISIGELAKQKFKQGIPEAAKVYSSVSFRDCVEILCGQIATKSLHQLYQRNGLLVVAATSSDAYDIATLRQDEIVRALSQLGMGIKTIKIL